MSKLFIYKLMDGVKLQSDNKASYLFLCGNITQRECLQKKLFGRTRKHWQVVKSIKAGSILFLHNLKSNSLIGAFTAAGDGAWVLDPEAWANVSPLSFPAQIRVKWDQLKILENANTKFAFLNKRVCKLTEAQTTSILRALKNGADFNPMIRKTPLIPNAEKMFIEFLNAKGIGYIRFSQTLDDFSKALKSFKAKRPDFIVFSRNPVLIEIKPYPYDKEVTLEIDEIEKLRQLELLTRLRTIIVFPVDSQGIEWKSIDPLWIWAHGERKMRYHKMVLSVKTNRSEQLVLE